MAFGGPPPGFGGPPPPMGFGGPPPPAGFGGRERLFWQSHFLDLIPIFDQPDLPSLLVALHRLSLPMLWEVLRLVVSTF